MVSQSYTQVWKDSSVELRAKDTLSVHGDCLRLILDEMSVAAMLV
jgi:hypothetical protein